MNHYISENVLYEGIESIHLFNIKWFFYLWKIFRLLQSCVFLNGEKNANTLTFKA